LAQLGVPSETFNNLDEMSFEAAGGCGVDKQVDRAVDDEKIVGNDV